MSMVKSESTSSSTTGSLFRAAKTGNVEKLIHLLDVENIDIKATNPSGLNSLHVAAKDGNLSIVKELIKRKLDVNSATKKGNTALHIAALAGKLDIVTFLLENNADPNLIAQNAFTPLYMAAQEGHEDIVEKLLKNGANQGIGTKDGFTPLAVALQEQRSKVVSLLLEDDVKGRVKLPALHIAARKDDVKAAALILHNDHSSEVSSKRIVNRITESGFTALHIAAHYGNVGVASLLLNRGAAHNMATKTGITPLHVASKRGHTRFCAMLIDRDADLNAQTRDGLIPLHCAARSGHKPVVELLLDRMKTNEIARTKNGLSALHMAAQGGHVSVVRLLINRGYPVDDITLDYLTSLHIASHCGHEKVAQVLLSKNAKVDAQAMNGFTPLHVACKKHQLRMVVLLLNVNANTEAITESGLTPLHIACFMGHSDIIKILLEKGARLNVMNNRGETALHMSVRSGRTATVKLLLSHGAQPDLRKKETQTCLHLAARLNKLDIVKVLLEFHAKVDELMENGYSPLHVACQEGHVEICMLLLDYGASVTLKTKSGFTALHLASKYGRLAVANLLLKRSASPDAVGKDDLTPLHVAAHYDNQNVALLLLKSGASPYTPAKNAYTPLHIAAKKNQIDIAMSLMEYGASTGCKTRMGTTPLHLAAQGGHIDMCSLLAAKDANVNDTAKFNLTPMHLAAEEDRTLVVKLLYDNGALLDSLSKSGYTPLHVASHKGNHKTVECLLLLGARVNAKTKTGYTPLHLAAQQGHSQVINLLLRHGALPDELTNNGHTALSLANQFGYITVVDTLTEVTTEIIETELEKQPLDNPETLADEFMSDGSDDDDHAVVAGDENLTGKELQELGDDSIMATNVGVLMNQSNVTETDSVVDNKRHSWTSSASGSDNCSMVNRKISGFLVSFLVDARGGSMRGTRYPNLRIYVPPSACNAPTRITCRLARKRQYRPDGNATTDELPLCEDEGESSRILDFGGKGKHFLQPIAIEIPHFASLRGSEREIVVIRSDDGEVWREHKQACSDEEFLKLTGSPDLESAGELSKRHVVRVISKDLPKYFALYSRTKEEFCSVGPAGGILTSRIVKHVSATFPENALTKEIRVGLQACPISSDLCKRAVGNTAKASPIITVEPRRRKFHKSIVIGLPYPEGSDMKSFISTSEESSLRLLCSISGGTDPALWQDITTPTPLQFHDDHVSFTSTVSAKFWLVNCLPSADSVAIAEKIYEEAMLVPYLAKFVVLAKRVDATETKLRVFCITDEKSERTLENQEHFVEIARSRDIEILKGSSVFVECAGNLGLTKQTQPTCVFEPFRENRLHFSVRTRDASQDLTGRLSFYRDERGVKIHGARKAMCNLNITLPTLLKDPEFADVSREEEPAVDLTQTKERYYLVDPSMVAELQDSDDCHVNEGLSPVDVAEVMGKLVAVRQILDPESAGSNSSDFGKVPSRSASFDESAELIAEMKSSLAEVKTLLEEKTACYRKLSENRQVKEIQSVSVTTTEIGDDNNQNFTNAEKSNKNEIRTADKDVELRKRDPSDEIVKISVPTPNSSKDIDSSTHTSPSQRSDVENKFVAWCQESVQLSEDILRQVVKRDGNAVDNMAGFLSKNLDRAGRPGRRGEKRTGPAGVDEYIEDVVPVKSPGAFGDVSDISEFLARDLVDGQQNLKSSEGVSNFRLVCAASAHRSPTLEVIASNAFVVDRVKAFETASKGPSKLRTDVSSLESEMIYQRERLRALRVNDETQTSSAIENTGGSKHDTSFSGKVGALHTINTTSDTSSVYCKVNTSPAVDATSHTSVRRLLKQFENQMHSPMEESAKGQSGPSEVVNRAYQIMHDVERTAGEGSSSVTAYDGDMSLVEAYAEFENCRIGYMMEPSVFSGGNFNTDCVSQCSSRSEDYDDTDCELEQDSFDDESVVGVERDIKSPVEELISQQHDEKTYPVENLDDTDQHRIADDVIHVSPNEEYFPLSTARMVRKFDEMISHGTRRLDSNQTVCQSTGVSISDKKKYFEKPAIEEIVLQQHHAVEKCSVENLDDTERHGIADDIARAGSVSKVQPHPDSDEEYGSVDTATIARKFDEKIALEAHKSNLNQASCQSAWAFVSDEKQDFEKPVVEEVVSQQQCSVETCQFENLDDTEQHLIADNVAHIQSVSKLQLNPDSDEECDTVTAAKMVQKFDEMISLEAQKSGSNQAPCQNTEVVIFDKEQDFEKPMKAVSQQQHNEEMCSVENLDDVKQDQCVDANRTSQQSSENNADVAHVHHVSKVKPCSDSDEEYGPVNTATMVQKFDKMILLEAQKSNSNQTSCQSTEVSVSVKKQVFEKPAVEGVVSQQQHGEPSPVQQNHSLTAHEQPIAQFRHTEQHGCDEDFNLEEKSMSAQKADGYECDSRAESSSGHQLDSYESLEENRNSVDQCKEDNVIAECLASQDVDFECYMDCEAVSDEEYLSEGSLFAEDDGVLEPVLQSNAGDGSVENTSDAEQDTSCISGTASVKQMILKFSKLDRPQTVEDQANLKQPFDEKLATEIISSNDRDVLKHDAYARAVKTSSAVVVEERSFRNEQCFDGGLHYAKSVSPVHANVEQQNISDEQPVDCDLGVVEDCSTTEKASIGQQVSEELSTPIRGVIIASRTTDQVVESAEFDSSTVKYTMNEGASADAEIGVADCDGSETDDKIESGASNQAAKNLIEQAENMTPDELPSGAVDQTADSWVLKSHLNDHCDQPFPKEVSSQATPRQDRSEADDFVEDFTDEQPTQDNLLDENHSTIEDDCVTHFEQLQEMTPKDDQGHNLDESNQKLPVSVQDAITETAPYKNPATEDFCGQSSVDALQDHYRDSDCHTTEMNFALQSAVKDASNDDITEDRLRADEDIINASTAEALILEETQGNCHGAVPDLHVAEESHIIASGMTERSTANDFISGENDFVVDKIATKPTSQYEATCQSPEDSNDEATVGSLSVPDISAHTLGATQQDTLTADDCIEITVNLVPIQSSQDDICEDFQAQPSIACPPDEKYFEGYTTAKADDAKRFRQEDMATQKFISTDETCKILDHDLVSPDPHAKPISKEGLGISTDQDVIAAHEEFTNQSLDIAKRDLDAIEENIDDEHDPPYDENDQVADQNSAVELVLENRVEQNQDDSEHNSIIVLAKPIPAEFSEPNLRSTTYEPLLYSESTVPALSENIARQGITHQCIDIDIQQQGWGDGESSLSKNEKTSPDEHEIMNFDDAADGASVVEKTAISEDETHVKLEYSQNPIADCYEESAMSVDAEYSGIAVTAPSEQLAGNDYANTDLFIATSDDLSGCEGTCVEKIVSAEQQTYGDIHGDDVDAVKKDSCDTAPDYVRGASSVIEIGTNQFVSQAPEKTEHDFGSIDEGCVEELTSLEKQVPESHGAVVDDACVGIDSFGKTEGSYIAQLISPEEQPTDIHIATLQTEIVGEDHFDEAEDCYIKQLTSPGDQPTGIFNAVVQAEAVGKDHWDTTEDNYVTQLTSPGEQPTVILNTAVQAESVSEDHFDTSCVTQLTSPQEQKTEIPNAVAHGMYAREDNFDVAEDGYVTELASSEGQTLKIPNAAMQAEGVIEDVTEGICITQLTSPEEETAQFLNAAVQAEGVGAYHSDTTEDNEISNVAVRIESVTGDHFDATDDSYIGNLTSPDENPTQIPNATVHDLYVSEDKFSLVEDGYVAELSSLEKQSSEIPVRQAADSTQDCDATGLTSPEKQVTEIHAAIEHGLYVREDNFGVDEDGFVTELKSEKWIVGSSDVTEVTCTREDNSHIQGFAVREKQTTQSQDAAKEVTCVSEDHFGTADDVNMTELTEFTSPEKQTTESLDAISESAGISADHFGITEDKGSIQISDSILQIPCVSKDLVCATEDGYITELTSDDKQTSQIPHATVKDMVVIEGNSSSTELTPAEKICDEGGCSIQDDFNNTKNNEKAEFVSPTQQTMKRPSTQVSNTTLQDSENYCTTVTVTPEEALPSNLSDAGHRVQPVNVFEDYQPVMGYDRTERLLSQGESNSDVTDEHRVLAVAESEKQASLQSLDQNSDRTVLDCSQDQAVLVHRNAVKSEIHTDVTIEYHLAETVYVDPPALEEAKALTGDAGNHDLNVAIGNDTTNAAAVDGQLEFSIPNLDQIPCTFDCVRFVETSDSEPRESASEWDSSVTETTTEDQLVLREISGQDRDAREHRYSASEQSSTDASVVEQHSPVDDSPNVVFEASDCDVDFETEKAVDPAIINTVGIEAGFTDQSCISETAMSEQSTAANCLNQVNDENESILYSTSECDVTETFSAVPSSPVTEEFGMVKQTSTEKLDADKGLDNTPAQSPDEACSSDRDIDVYAVYDETESTWNEEADEMRRQNQDANACLQQSTECYQDSELTLTEGIGNLIHDEIQEDGVKNNTATNIVSAEQSSLELSTAPTLEHPIDCDVADNDIISEIDKAVDAEDNPQWKLQQVSDLSCDRAAQSNLGEEEYPGRLEKGAGAHEDVCIVWTDVHPTPYSGGSFLPPGESLATVSSIYRNREVNAGGNHEFVDGTLSPHISVQESDSTQIIPNDDTDSVTSDDSDSKNKDRDIQRDFKLEEFDDVPPEHSVNDVGGTTENTGHNAAQDALIDIKETPVPLTADCNVQECAEPCKDDFAHDKLTENIAHVEHVTTVISNEQKCFEERYSVDNVTPLVHYGLLSQTATRVYDTDTYNTRNDLFSTSLRDSHPSDGNSIAPKVRPDSSHYSPDENTDKSDHSDSDSECVASVLSLQSVSPVSQEQAAFSHMSHYPDTQSSESNTSVAMTNQGIAEYPALVQTDGSTDHKSDLKTEIGIASSTDCADISDQWNPGSEKSSNEIHQGETSHDDDRISNSIAVDSSISTATARSDANTKADVDLDDVYDKLWSTAQYRRKSCELTSESKIEQGTDGILSETSKPSVTAYTAIPTVVVTSTDGSCQARDSTAIEDESSASEAESACVQSEQDIAQDVDNRESFDNPFQLQAYQSNVSLDSLEGDTICAVDGAGYDTQKTNDRTDNFAESDTSTSTSSSECGEFHPFGDRDREYERIYSDDENVTSESPVAGGLSGVSKKNADCNDEVDSTEECNDDACQEEANLRDLSGAVYSCPETSDIHVNVSMAHTATNEKWDPSLATQDIRSDLRVLAHSDFILHKGIAGDGNVDVLCLRKGTGAVNELDFYGLASDRETDFCVSPRSAGVIPSAPLLSDCRDKNYDELTQEYSSDVTLGNQHSTESTAVESVLFSNKYDDVYAGNSPCRDVIDTAASRDIDLANESMTGSVVIDFLPQKDATLYSALTSVTGLASGGLKLSNLEDVKDDVKSQFHEFRDTDNTQSHFCSETHESASVSWTVSENDGDEMQNHGLHGPQDRAITNLALATFASQTDSLSSESQKETSRNLINFATDLCTSPQPASSNMFNTDAECIGSDQASGIRSTSMETIRFTDNVTQPISRTIPFASDTHHYYASQDSRYDHYGLQQAEYKSQFANYSTEIPVTNAGSGVTSVVWSGAVADCVVSDGLAISRRDSNEHYVQSVTQTDVSGHVEDIGMPNVQFGELSLEAECHASYTRHDMTRVVSSERETLETQKEFVTSSQFESTPEPCASNPIIPMTQWWDNQVAYETSMRDISRTSGSLQTVQDHQWAAFCQSRALHSETAHRTVVSSHTDICEEISNVSETVESASSSVVDGTSVWREYSGTSDAARCQSNLEASFHAIASELGLQWMELARNLDISESSVWNIQKECGGDIGEKGFCLLTLWYEKNRQKYECEMILKDALEKIKRQDLARHIRTGPGNQPSPYRHDESAFNDLADDLGTPRGTPYHVSTPYPFASGAMETISFDKEPLPLYSGERDDEDDPNKPHFVYPEDGLSNGAPTPRHSTSQDNDRQNNNSTYDKELEEEVMRNLAKRAESNGGDYHEQTNGTEVEIPEVMVAVNDGDNVEVVRRVVAKDVSDVS